MEKLLISFQLWVLPALLWASPVFLKNKMLLLKLPVASLEDVLQGKIWAAQDSQRRGSKRQKDLADIARILEKYPTLRVKVPQEIRARLVDDSMDD